MSAPNRLIIAITGASGTCYGVRILEALKESDVETHLVMSDSAKLTMTMTMETDYSPGYVESPAKVVHNSKNVGATLILFAVRKAPTSFRMDAIFCSVGIAGYRDLKRGMPEFKPLLCAPRARVCRAC